MLRSPLDARHRGLGAKMGAFAGWEMPISYAGTVAEHVAVRERVGMFDVSHLGKLRVRGVGARTLLDGQLTNRMADLDPGRARYTLLCADDGGIIDDLIVYAIGDDDFLVVPNAANTDAVHARLAAAAGADATVNPLEWITFAVQGPRSPEVVAERFPVAKGLRYMRVTLADDVLVARSGYTGEVGFEVYAPAARAGEVWDDLLEAIRAAGGEPCGLAARDTLRLEMGYPLHGNDIDLQTTPLDAGLAWAVVLEGRSFPGRDALASTHPARRLIGVRMHDRLIPRHGHPLLRDGEVLGHITSGTFSPTLRVGIGMGYVPTGTVAEDDEVQIDVRGKIGRAVVVRPPFVERSPR